MSVTGHRDVRLADDSYSTPEWCTRLLLPHLQRGDVLEPCCGTGAIGRVVREVWNQHVHVFGREIDEGRAEAARGLRYNSQMSGNLEVFEHIHTEDFLTSDVPTIGGEKYVPLVITNPPFSLALEFVKRSMLYADTVAMLLRLAWLSSAERNAFHRDHPSDLIVLPKRPSFAKFVRCASKEPIGNSDVCGWNEALPPDAPTPKACLVCGAKVKASTSDSADYGWFLFGPGRSGRIIHPDMTDVAKVLRDSDQAMAEASK